MRPSEAGLTSHTHLSCVPGNEMSVRIQLPPHRPAPIIPIVVMESFPSMPLAAKQNQVYGFATPRAADNVFCVPGSASDATAARLCLAVPRCAPCLPMDARQSLAGSAVPGRAWDRGLLRYA